MERISQSMLYLKDSFKVALQNNSLHVYGNLVKDWKFIYTSILHMFISGD